MLVCIIMTIKAMFSLDMSGPLSFYSKTDVADNLLKFKMMVVSGGKVMRPELIALFRLSCYDRVTR